MSLHRERRHPESLSQRAATITSSPASRGNMPPDRIRKGAKPSPGSSCDMSSTKEDSTGRIRLITPPFTSICGTIDKPSAATTFSLPEIYEITLSGATDFYPSDCEWAILGVIGLTKAEYCGCVVCRSIPAQPMIVVPEVACRANGPYPTYFTHFTPEQTPNEDVMVLDRCLRCHYMGLKCDIEDRPIAIYCYLDTFKKRIEIRDNKSKGKKKLDEFDLMEEEMRNLQIKREKLTANLFYRKTKALKAGWCRRGNAAADTAMLQRLLEVLKVSK